MVGVPSYRESWIRPWQGEEGRNEGRKRKGVGVGKIVSTTYLIVCSLLSSSLILMIYLAETGLVTLIEHNR